MNLTDPKIDTKTRKSINVHVQRVDRQKKRWEKIKRPLENREIFPSRLQPAPCRCGHPLTALSTSSRSVSGTQNVERCQSCGGLLPSNVRSLGLKVEQLAGVRSGISGQRRLPSPAVLLGQGRTNPFKTYPIETQPETDMLVYFCECINPIPFRILDFCRQASVTAYLTFTSCSIHRPSASGLR